MTGVALKDLRKDLPDKEKSIDDLIRFIKNRNDENPNYSIFLGSGCSISSGIRSGAELANAWRKEVYCKLSEVPESGYNEAAAVDFLSRHEYRWYDQRNEYASLFEKKYNLPRQRRVFIEQEVSGKQPSIGYGYLVKLVEQSYFSTIFTTNFDDLMNFSFYLYGRKDRPIVCAHDSAINSVSITSRRPKIIKLHGDYLFDDIKNTRRDMESLEGNMNAKFSEFAKDYGLIIVGYGGNDRSIMDILHYLLKYEHNFSHGIYWCVKNSETAFINDEVRKLLWKDRVYYVPIDGYDELFAEISSKISDNSALPYEAKFTEELIENLRKIKQDKIQFSACSYIMNDLNECAKKVSKATLRNIKTVPELLGEGDAPKKNTKDDFDDLLKKQNILEKVEDKLYSEAIKEAQKALEEGLKSKEITSDIHSLIAYCHHHLNDDASSIASLRQLMKYNNDNQIHNNTPLYHRIASITKNIEHRIEVLKEAIEFNPHDAKSYMLLAGAYINAKSESLVNNLVLDPEITRNFRLSIQKDPSRSNPAPFKFFRFKLDLAGSADDFKACEEILANYRAQDPFDIDVIDCMTNLKLKQKITKDEIIKFLGETKTESKNYNRYPRYDAALLDVLDEVGTYEDFEQHFSEMDKIYNDDLKYQARKASTIAEKFRNLPLAISHFEEILQQDYKEEELLPLKVILIRYYLYNYDYNKAIKLKEELPITHLESVEDLFTDYRCANGEAEKILQELEAKRKDPNFYPTSSFYMRYSFVLLVAKRYEDVQRLLRPILENLSFGKDLLVINYELAKKLSGNKIKKERLGGLTKNPNVCMQVKMAAHLILSSNVNDEDYSKAITIAKGEIKKDYTDFYRFKRWPVFRDVNMDLLKQEQIPYNAAKSNITTLAA